MRQRGVQAEWRAYGSAAAEPRSRRRSRRRKADEENVAGSDPTAFDGLRDEANAMATERSRRQKSADWPDRPPVKCSVLLDVETHARLAAVAALRGCDRSTIAAEAIREGLRGGAAFDRGSQTDPVKLAGEGISGVDAA